jgi:hypothetical protein
MTFLDNISILQNEVVCIHTIFCIFVLLCVTLEVSYNGQKIDSAIRVMALSHFLRSSDIRVQN